MIRFTTANETYEVDHPRIRRLAEPDYWYPFRAMSLIQDHYPVIIHWPYNDVPTVTGIVLDIQEI